MKKIRCPKCEHVLTFDDKKYKPGQVLVFHCPNCGKKFGIRMKVDGAPSAPPAPCKDETPAKVQAEDKSSQQVGHLIVIENKFHYKQLIPLQMGDNIIGRDQNDKRVNCPIQTSDPSMDITHCHIQVSRDKKGRLKYVLSDGPSYTGTFVDNEILGDKERRVISDGTLFTIGATSIILKTTDENE